MGKYRAVDAAREMAERQIGPLREAMARRPLVPGTPRAYVARIKELEAALRDVVETSHGAGSEHWSACVRARKVLGENA